MMKHVQTKGWRDASGWQNPLSKVWARKIMAVNGHFPACHVWFTKAMRFGTGMSSHLETGSAGEIGSESGVFSFQDVVHYPPLYPPVWADLQPSCWILKDPSWHDMNRLNPQISGGPPDFFLSQLTWLFFACKDMQFFIARTQICEGFKFQSKT